MFGKKDNEELLNQGERSFIGESMHLEPVIVRGQTSVRELLTYYMGKNTIERQNFIIDNLRIEEDILEKTLA